VLLAGLSAKPTAKARTTAAQMTADLIILGIGARIILGAVMRGRRRRHPARTEWRGQLTCRGTHTRVHSDPRRVCTRGDSFTVLGLDDGFHRIGSDPFAVPPEARDEARRLRGRLPTPVTVWTTYGPSRNPTGITVSSVLIAEGEPPTVLGLIAPLSEFWESVKTTKRFVMHVLDLHHTRVADQFALRYPGDPFEGLAVSASDYGPLLDDVATRAQCTLSSYLDAEYSLLVRAWFDDVELDSDPAQPLIHYRGRYLTVESRRQ
jgi:3-hydroxy-9,10-secoandrosta-1,3,5(10)-triene-9,17-dione monooxygenase reductase component